MEENGVTCSKEEMDMKKAKEKKAVVDEGRPLDFDPEAVLDNGYKRHLHRHSNKYVLAELCLSWLMAVSEECIIGIVE